MKLKLEILLLLLSPIPISATIALYNNTLSYTLPPISVSSPRPPPSVEMAPFKPSIAVIVAVLTAMFSVTFLLLLYAKHCKRGNGNDDLRYYGVPASAATRKTSGVDRKTIESLPVFRFGALRGEKDGLECAVCLNRFEHTEVLRLLPKCKHAFHVECVDTWLEAHSTCPLCRYRVEPEDILLCRQSTAETERAPSPPPLRRVSGRHSSAGERGLQIVVELPPRGRRSCDSWNWKKGAERRDDVLLAGKDRSSDRRKLEHRIVIGEETEMKQRWSDVQPSDLLYLRSEMIMSDSRRFSISASGSRPLKQQCGNSSNEDGCSGRGVINGRSVSEITGLSRFKKETTTYRGRERVLSRWLAWVPQSQSHIDTLQLPAVR